MPFLLIVKIQSIITIIISYSLRVFWTKIVADIFSLEYEWQQVSLGL